MLSGTKLTYMEGWPRLLSESCKGTGSEAVVRTEANLKVDIAQTRRETVPQIR